MTNSPDKPCDYGHYLQLNRRSRGKSLEEIAAVTKIPVNRLKQLEAQDLDNLPAPVFVKGFVRAYAVAVGADVEDALQRFDTSCSISLPQEQAIVDDQQAPGWSWPGLLLAVVLLVALISVTLLVSAVMNPVEDQIVPSAQHEKRDQRDQRDQRNQRDQRDQRDQPNIGDLGDLSGPDDLDVLGVEKTPGIDSAPEAMPATQPKGEPVPVDAPNERAADSPAISSSLKSPPASDNPTVPTIPAIPDSPKPEPVASADKPVVEAAADGVAAHQIAWALQIQAIEPTWLTVSADAGSSVEMTLKPGEIVNFKAADHFKLFIGNAGGIFLTLNDQSIGVPGNSGEVITLRLP
jgi:cytoskeletal protein RodZ